jgi:predicted RNA-binding Zn ribbon-like protein
MSRVRARWEDDVDVAVALLNTVDHLEDPADRLVDIKLLRAILADGDWADDWADLGRQLQPADLPGVRARREQLRRVFTAPTPDERTRVLNDLLRSSGAQLQVVPLGDDRCEVVIEGPTPLDTLAARLATALAQAVAARGFSRLGACDASPCSCVYIDRTRAGNRRYCCDICNDRAAAAAYRRRRASRSGTPRPPQSRDA